MSSSPLICPACLARYAPGTQICADATHARRTPLVALDHADDPRVGRLLDEPGSHPEEDLAPAGARPLAHGRYLVLGLLGEGAMGIVYRAWQRGTGREVALKVLHLDPRLVAESPSEYDELRARFQREVALSARLDSPLIARVFDSGELADGGLFFAMEKVNGLSLDKVLLAESRLPIERVVRLGFLLGEALAAVHEQGLVHRDVKPGNIIVSGAGPSERLRLVDFGIARAFSESPGRPRLTRLTADGTLIGTLAYMAPEQLAGNGQRIGPTADVYAMGATLYELVTGSLPFPGPTPAAFSMQHRTAPIPSLVRALDADPDEHPTLARLDRLVQSMLAKAPAARPPDGVAVARALAEVLPAPAHRGLGARAGSVEALAQADDPAALAQAAEVLARLTPRRRARLVTPGRLAFVVAAALGLATLVQALV